MRLKRMGNKEENNMDKQKEILELKKLYIIQFEKFETKIYLSWFGFFLSIFVAWVYGKISGYFVFLIAILTCLLDLIFQCWRKKAFNKIINEIKSNNFEEI